jgi:LAO/AO transport system kinase
MYETINEVLKSNFYNNALIQSRLEEEEKKVLKQEVSSFVAAQTLLDEYLLKQ